MSTKLETVMAVKMKIRRQMERYLNQLSVLSQEDLEHLIQIPVESKSTLKDSIMEIERLRRRASQETKPFQGMTVE